MVAWVEVTSIIGTGVIVITALAVTQRYNADRRGQIYERLDECKAGFKKEIKEDYARRDLCKVTHEHVDAKLTAIELQTAHIPTIVAQLEILVNGKNKDG